MANINEQEASVKLTEVEARCKFNTHRLDNVENRQNALDKLAESIGRTGEAAGGTIVLRYLPHELVGNYFTAVNM